MEKPGQSAHKGIDFFSESQSGVSKNDSHDVDSQIGISFQQVRNGEGNEYQAQQEDWVKRTVGQVDAVYQPYAESSHGVTDDSTEEELHEQVFGNQ